MTIVKDFHNRDSSDPKIKAGYNAERQMAYYLRRSFGDRPELHVINDLRLSFGVDTCQIDHLIAHRYGIVIIESKSVTTRVRVNELNEWERLIDDTWRGMASPIAQAKLQAKTLSNILDNNRERLIGKILGIQKRFFNYDISYLVAISDSGAIDRSSPLIAAEALKADMICDQAHAIIARQTRDCKFKLNFTGKVGIPLSESELQSVVQFFLASNQPLGAAIAGTTPKKMNPPTRLPPPKRLPASIQPVTTCPEPASSSNLKCTKCLSGSGSIQYGKFGYYWKCSACEANSKLPLPGPGRLRKEGTKFTYVADDGRETLFHCN